MTTRKLDPFVLDLGAAYVSVEEGELHEKACAVALFPERRIVIDVARTGGARITGTLWHECFHHLDDLFLGQWLSDKHHTRLDIIANLIDMTLTRNWQVFRQLYDTKVGKKNVD